MAEASQAVTDHPDAPSRRPQDCKTMSESLSVLCCSPEMADVHFTFPDSCVRLPAHRFALAIRSSVFKAMFFGSLPEEGQAITVTDVPPDIFTSLLRYFVVVYARLFLCASKFSKHLVTIKKTLIKDVRWSFIIFKLL